MTNGSFDILSHLSCCSSCLQYQHLSLEEYLFISGNDASCRSDNHLPRPCQSEKITQRHPTMAICSGNDVSVSARWSVGIDVFVCLYMCLWVDECVQEYVSVGVLFLFIFLFL